MNKNSAKDYVEAYSACVTDKNYLHTYSDKVSEKQLFNKINKESGRPIILKVLKKYRCFCLCEVLGMSIKTCVSYMDLINKKNIMI